MILSVNEFIALRKIALADADDLFSTIDRHREYFRKWLPFVDYTKSIADTLAFISSVYACPEEKRESVFVILYKNTFVGLIGFKDTDRVNGKTEIGYWLSEAHQGLGIMTRSVSRLLQYAFDEQKMNRVQIKCAVGNSRSSNIPRRLLFQFEGIERAGELSSEGFYFDLEVYSLLKSEYVKNNLYKE